ncbi:MAG: histidine kinase dimerization/phosphoacceptor domain -containing protein [Candidatus Aminicenantes bacterium]|jgi:PAS domain S-box-containing protein
MKHSTIPVIIMILMVILIMLPMVAYSQTYLNRSYTVNDGLVNPTINDITQDKTGRMWFATPIGVTCYDGTTWKNYSASHGLPRQIYTKIRADTQGHIWAFPKYLGDGIYIFDRKRQTWNHLEKPPDIGAGKISIASVAMMELPSPRGGICVGIGTGEQGFHIYTKQGWIQAGKGQGRNSILKVDHYNHFFYVVTESSVFVINPGRPHHWIKKDFKPPFLPICSLTIETVPDSVTASAFVPEPRIWLSGNKWVGYYFQDRFHLLYQGDFPQFYEQGHYKRIITQPDRFGGLWLANSWVILNLDKTGQIKVIGMPETLTAAGARSFFYDRESNFWIGTYRGVIKIISFRFENYRRKHGLYDDEVSAITGFDNGGMVFGHNSGFTFFFHNQFHISEIPGSDRKNVGDSRVLDMCTDRQGNIWAAVSRKGIVKISPEKKMKWCRVVIDGKPHQGEIYFTSVLCDSQGNIWAAGNHYVFQWKKNRFISRETGIKPGTRIRRLFKGKENAIYIATINEGLLQLKNNKIKQFPCPGNEAANSIYAVYPGKKDNVLVGTEAGLYTLENDQLVKFHHHNFQVDDPVFFITEDRDGYLWFGLNNGVIKWDGFNRANGTKGEQVRHYTRADGLAGNETNRAASFVDQNGRLWIGTENGVSCYYQEKDRICKIPPLLELLYLQVSQQTHRYPLNHDHSFEHDLNDLIFHFRGISFIDENAVKYNFKLEGIDRQWITDYQSPDNQIRYFNVSPGKYRFHIQAINSLGSKSSIISSGLITIKKPFFHTWWFYSIFVGVIVLLIFFIANTISKRQHAAHLEEQIRERTKQVEESEKELRNIFNSAHDAIIIMDPHQEIVYDVNDRACEIYGFSRQEFIGMSMAALSKDVVLGQERVKETLQQGDVLNFETIQYRKDGAEMFLEINASVINYRRKLAILSINRDITQRKRAEQQIKKSLEEKEILLKEIHHRVKNNLQVISSLLDLQADALGDQHINKAIQDSKDRIHSMALVHENLYQFGDLARINVNQYLHKLVEYLFETYGDWAGNITARVKIETPSLELDMETAIPIGLILTELLSNVLKHAFPHGEKGEVHITVRPDNPGMLTLVVRDNGLGLPPHLNPSESQSLGLQLVHLLTRQLKGTIEIKKSKGTTVTITFPYKASYSRESKQKQSKRKDTGI